MERAEQRQEKVGQLVLFPAPYHGHIMPMLELATLLHSRGFSITVAHTSYRSPKATDYPAFHFEPISDGLDGSSEEEASNSNKDIIVLCSTVNVNCEAPFRDLMVRKLLENKENKIVGIISDAFLHFTQRVADQLKIPRIALWLASAVCFLAFPLLPVQDRQSEEVVPELPVLRVKDLPDIVLDKPKIWYKLLEDTYTQVRASAGIALSTCEHLEQMMLMKIQQNYQIPTIAVGPLHSHASSSSSSLQVQDQNCMAWLEKQKLGSVIYVNFGSFVTVPKTELLEIAWGLANSKQPFLWVVRPGLVEGSEEVDLPECFQEETRERSLIVKLAPLREVLAHPAVGGFWTHSCWKSVLESIGEGIPMLCSPYYGDQKVNARMVSHVWRVGIQLENGLGRGEIERRIIKLMVEKEGKEMRERARSFKEELCLSEGDSSCESLGSLIDLIS